MKDELSRLESIKEFLHRYYVTGEGFNDYYVDSITTKRLKYKSPFFELFGDTNDQ